VVVETAQHQTPKVLLEAILYLAQSHLTAVGAGLDLTLRLLEQTEALVVAVV
jgi:hypothetical protein